MTRRKDPHKRIKELSDASVPYNFTVEMLIENDDAPKLERAIHKQLAPFRINKGKEFFKCSLSTIKTALKTAQEKMVQ